MQSLTDEERALLAAGVLQWGGPAAPTDSLAVALGAQDVSLLLSKARKVHAALTSKAEVSDADLLFALLSTEINFASDWFGAGVEWEVVSGYSDAYTVAMLRGIQKKLVDLEH